MLKHPRHLPVCFAILLCAAAGQPPAAAKGPKASTGTGPRAPDWIESGSFAVGRVAPSGLRDFIKGAEATASAQGLQGLTLARALPQSIFGADLWTSEGWQALGLQPTPGAQASAAVVALKTIPNLGGPDTLPVMRGRMVFEIADPAAVDSALARLAPLVPNTIVAVTGGGAGGANHSAARAGDKADELANDPVGTAFRAHAGLGSDSARAWSRAFTTGGGRLAWAGAAHAVFARIVGRLLIVEWIMPLSPPLASSWIGSVVPSAAIVTPPRRRKQLVGGLAAALATAPKAAVWAHVNARRFADLVPHRPRCQALASAAQTTPFASFDIAIGIDGGRPSFTATWRSASGTNGSATPSNPASSAAAKLATPTPAQPRATTAAIAQLATGATLAWLAALPPTPGSIWGALRLWPECGAMGTGLLFGGGWAALMSRWLAEAYAVDAGVKTVAEGTLQTIAVVENGPVIATEGAMTAEAASGAKAFLAKIFGEPRRSGKLVSYGAGPLRAFERPSTDARAATRTLGAVYGASPNEPRLARSLDQVAALLGADAIAKDGSSERLVRAVIYPGAAVSLLEISSFDSYAIAARMVESVEVLVTRDGPAVSATLLLDLL